MLNLRINGQTVPYDTLDEARKAAKGELSFWRETLELCAKDEKAWNDFINELWQNGGAEEAVRLYAVFGGCKSKRWVLMALLLENGGDGELWKDIVSAMNDDVEPLIGWLKRSATHFTGLTIDVAKDGTLKDAIIKALNGSDDAFHEWIRTFRGQSDCIAPVLAHELEYWQKIKSAHDPQMHIKGEMTITLSGGVPMTFCWCPATTSEEWKKISGGEDFFWMGSPMWESDRCSDETRHRVKLTQGFWIGKYPVTQRQWIAVMGTNPSKFDGEDRPMEMISWDGCQDFIRKVCSNYKVHVSLPTEAQWEYACRAGTTTPFNFGLTLNGDKANCDGNNPYGMSNGRYRGETSPVGEYSQNEWGLYDMHGNVSEWCQDWYGKAYCGDATNPTGPASGTKRVRRGGCWGSDARFCRSASRYGAVPGSRFDSLGLRLICSASVSR